MPVTDGAASPRSVSLSRFGLEARIDVPGGDAMNTFARLAAVCLPYLAVSMFAAPVQAQSLPPIDWEVASRFPQYREHTGRNSAWRTPVVPGTRASVLPLAEESWPDWYKRLAAPGESPYAAWMGTWRDAWDEAKQRYEPDFLDYVRSDQVLVRLSPPKNIDRPATCAWDIGAGERRADPACRGIEARLPTRATAVTLYDGDRAIASSEVRPQRMIVLGLGDSYASGEGNPDVPTHWHDESVVPPDPAYWKPANLDWLVFEPGEPNPRVRSGARWRDPNCHRSFWNQQNFAAMRLAAEEPQREVVFLQFACSGAEALDGLLVRQLDPPGIGANDKSGCGAGRDPRCRVPYSQLAAAVTALCRNHPGAIDAALRNRLEKQIVRHGARRWEKLGAYREGKRRDAPYGLDLLDCDSLAKPDLVLLSMGGNDAGFASLVAWALMPAQPRYWIADNTFNAIRAFAVICPDQDENWIGCSRRRASGYAAQLPPRYRVFGEALRASGLADDPRRVVLSSYPDPLRMRKDPQTGVAGLCADDSEQASPWYALNLFVPKVARSFGNWDFGLRNSGKGRNNRAPEVLTAHVLPGIRSALRASAQKQGYTYVDKIETAFEGRSWCDEPAEERERLGLPSDSRTAWNGSPASWRPYAPRMRAIRTANDSYMTQLSQRSGDKNGAMHPTAEGHMLLAEQVYLSAMKVLQNGSSTGAAP